MRRQYFLDTEFLEQGPEYPILPISIGIVDEDGREFYREYQSVSLNVVEWSQTWPAWHRENVLPSLIHYNGRCEGGYGDCPLAAREEIAADILAFVGADTPQWVGYYADYDHVVLCQTFGRMIDLPTGWPMWTYDIKQRAKDIIGNARLPRPEHESHSAIEDARWNRWAMYYLDAVMANDQVLAERMERLMRFGSASS